MFKVKNFLEPVEDNDGQRIWVEPVGLTRDLQEWCKVDHVLCNLGPPRELVEWLQEHPDGYDYFRGRYHDCLNTSSNRTALQQLACAAMKQDFTLLHDSDDPEHNTATALYEFLCELEAWCPRDEEC